VLQLTPDDEVGAAREEEYIELARWYIARRRGSAILPMLARMSIAAEGGGRTRSVVELQLLQALARQQEGDLRRAGVALESALPGALHLRDRRMLLDAGRDVVTLLRRIVGAGGLPPDVQEFVDALLEDASLSGAAAQTAPGPTPAKEPLSRQELQVLRMLGAGYSNAEIGRALFISPNTVKTHVRHIFEKLAVRTRSAAVSRAAALRLLEF
jgi:LuxR family maltose regulon positive regulatory protein